MPHCIIEITGNLIPHTDCNKLMCDTANAIFSLGCFSENDIKIRIRPVSHSYMGIRDQAHAYVATDVQVMNNKTPEQLEQLIGSVHSAVQSHFANITGLFSITTKISFLETALYRRNLQAD